MSGPTITEFGLSGPGAEDQGSKYTVRRGGIKGFKRGGLLSPLENFPRGRELEEGRASLGGDHVTGDAE